MNDYKIKVLSLNKIHWIYCNWFELSTDGIIFKKEGDSKVYYLDGKNNLLLEVYENINNKWFKYYDYNTSYGIRMILNKKEE